jgi:hypothetical protein
MGKILHVKKVVRVNPGRVSLIPDHQVESGPGKVGSGWVGLRPDPYPRSSQARVLVNQVSRVRQRKFFLEFKTPYSLQICLISIQISNDFYSQNKIREHFITQ